MFLIPDRGEHRGVVTVGDIWAQEVGDSLSGPDFAYPERAWVKPSTRIASQHVTSESPNAYLRIDVVIPSRLPDSTRVRYGNYALGAMVTGGNRYVCEAFMEGLMVE
ncbi:MAG: hypothetical protein KKA42_13590 [candidate division Zixibacteria bacterium]|nr:hypothetical protein [candidate division Zixibacteria bacterium]